MVRQRVPGPLCDSVRLLRQLAPPVPVRYQRQDGSRQEV